MRTFLEKLLHCREGHVLTLWPKNVLVCCEMFVRIFAAENHLSLIFKLFGW